MAGIARVVPYVLDMDAALVTQPMMGILQRTDRKADTIQITLRQSGQAVSLTGATAYAMFKRPVDGSQIRNPGTVSGGTVTITLTDQCYKHSGPFELLAKLSSNGVERTILRLTGYVEEGGDGVIVDPTGSIPSYDDLAEAIAAANAAAATANEKATAANAAAAAASEKATAANAAATNAQSVANTVQQKLDNGDFVGPKGDPGQPGATPNIQIGTVTTGNPGTDAAASMGGTAENPTLNLTIPRGADGSGSVSTVDGVQPDSGDVPLGAVRYNADQNLTDEQQARARGNIGAAQDAAMIGATAAAAGAAGLVPTPAAGDEKKALLGDGTWGKVAASGVHVGDSEPTDEDATAWIDTSEIVSGFTVAELFLLCHPVGSYYWSDVATSPQTLYGGTWEQIKDRFVLAAGDAYAAGTTGGEAAHTLTIDEMPAHKHDLYKTGTDGNATLAIGQDGSYANADYAALGTSVKPFAEATINISTVGSGAAHNNMPPYTVAYCWRRTA